MEAAGSVSGYAAGMNVPARSSVWAAIERRPALTDAVIAALLAALATIWLWLRWPPERLPATAIVATLGVVQCLPLAWRRRDPLIVLAVVTVGTIFYGLAGGADTPWAANAWLLAAYSAGAYGGGRGRDPIRLAATLTFVGYVAYEVLLAMPAAEPDPIPTMQLVLFRLFTLGGNTAFAVWVWWFGNATRLRHVQERQLAERTRELDQQREANTRRAVMDERVSIAREVHDVVAHHVSLMGLQAGAARRVLRRQPDRAEEVLSLIEGSGRQAVLELQQLVGFLRQDQDDDGMTPMPSLMQLDDLIGHIRDGGLPVTMRVEGAKHVLSPGIDLGAYRIIQEALTNTVRHAGRTTATVILRYRDDRLELEIRDDGRAQPSTRSPKGGNGLIGMRERAILLGGSLEAGPEAGGGFRVFASLPLDGRSR